MLLLAAGVTGPVALSLVLLLTGLLLVPFVITCSALVDDVAPQAMLTEAYAITVMANVGGGALGMAMAGALADEVGPAGTLLFGATSMAAGAITDWLRRPTFAMLTA